MCNSRFLKALGAHAKLASHVLSLVVFRLAEDGSQMEGASGTGGDVLSMESCTRAHYRAAGYQNWTKCGPSQIRTGRKDLYVKALQKDACAILRGERRTQKTQDMRRFGVLSNPRRRTVDLVCGRGIGGHRQWTRHAGTGASLYGVPR